jgi:hypothetical protein
MDELLIRIGELYTEARRKDTAIEQLQQMVSAKDKRLKELEEEHATTQETTSGESLVGGVLPNKA